MTRSRVVLIGVLLLAVDAALLLFQYAEVIGNIEAEVILGTWQSVGVAAWLKARMDRHHAALHERLNQQDAALAETHHRVRELHDLHLGLKLPPSQL